MLRGYVPLHLRVGFLCPLTQDRSTQFSNFINDSIFRIVRITTIAHGLLKSVDDLVQSFEQLRSPSEALFESMPIFGGR